MPKFYLRWQLDQSRIPVDPEERAKLWLSMLKMVKDDLKAGTISDWGMFSDSSCGYGFSELSAADLNSALLKWMPYVTFDVKPALTVDETTESIKKAAAAVKK